MDNKELKDQLRRAVESKGPDPSLILPQPTDDPEITSLRKKVVQKIWEETREFMDAHPEERKKAILSIARGSMSKSAIDREREIFRDLLGAEPTWEQLMCFRMGVHYMAEQLGPLAMGRVKSGREYEEMQTIKRGLAEGKSLQAIGKELRITDKTVKARAIHFGLEHLLKPRLKPRN